MLLRFRQQFAMSGARVSKLYDQDSFYPAFLHDLSRCTKTAHIESPYITERRMNTLYPALERLIRQNVRVTVNTRNPVEHEDERLKRQSIQAIYIMQQMGIQVLITGGHHRKLAIIDHCIVWEGSLNILSQGDSCEIMRRIGSNELAEQTIQFLKLDKYL